MKRKRDLRTIPIRFLVTKTELEALKKRAEGASRTVAPMSVQSFARWISLRGVVHTESSIYGFAHHKEKK